LNAKIGGFTDFFRDIGLRKSISFTRRRHVTDVGGVVGSAFRLKQSYSTSCSVSTVMGECLRTGTAIGFRASREH